MNTNKRSAKEKREIEDTFISLLLDNKNEKPLKPNEVKLIFEKLALLWDEEED